MKKLKKLLSIVLAVAMVMSLVVSVTAVDTNTYTITINNETDNYVYTAYQIFAGDLSGTTLSNIVWGSALSTTDQTSVLTNYSTILDGTKYESSAAGLAAALAAGDIDAEAFAKYLTSTYTLTSAATSGSFDTDHYTISVTGAGYYLIESTTVPSAGAYTDYILTVVANTSVTAKKSVPSLDKSVEDVNDSGVATTNADNDTADYDIGDDVPFTLTATIGDYYENYITYALTFHDTLSDGLSFNYGALSDVTVTVWTAYTYNTLADHKWVTGVDYYIYNTSTCEFEIVDKRSVTAPVGGTTYYTYGGVAVSGYSVTYNSAQKQSDGCTFEVVIANTDALDDGNDCITVTSGSIITVDYTAKLNGTTSAYYETNTAKITYSNDPNNSSKTGTTPEETNTVYYYSLTVNKVDDQTSPKALIGAGFTLYKMVKFTGEIFDTNTTYYELSDSVYTETSEASPQSGVTYYYFEAVEDEVGYDDYDISTFTWTGLDDGVYKLVETTTPSGYNTMVDKYFSISATHEKDVGGTASLTALDIYDVSEGTNTLTVTSTKLSEETDAEYTTSTTTGSITTTIQNNKGTDLPETGGIGVTIFYVVGGILILAAAGVIVINRKKTKAEK